MFDGRDFDGGGRRLIWRRLERAAQYTFDEVLPSTFPAIFGKLERDGKMVEGKFIGSLYAIDALDHSNCFEKSWAGDNPDRDKCWKDLVCTFTHMSLRGDVHQQAIANQLLGENGLLWLMPIYGHPVAIGIMSDVGKTLLSAGFHFMSAHLRPQSEETFALLSHANNPYWPELSKRYNKFLS